MTFLNGRRRPGTHRHIAEEQQSSAAQRSAARLGRKRQWAAGTTRHWYTEYLCSTVLYRPSMLPDGR